MSKVSAIAWRHKATRNISVGLSARHKIVIEGMARSRVTATRSEPVSPAMLRRYYRAVKPTTRRDNAIWGSVVLAFFFCMRASEYASTPAKTGHHLRQQDVQFHDKRGNIARHIKEAESVHVFFRSSKTDQTARGCTRSLSRSGNPVLCPVIAAWRLRAIGKEIGAGPSDPLCVYTTKHGKRCHVSIAVVTDAVRRAARAQGANPRSFSSHSLRSGGATQMFLGGSSDATVQLFGRWKSDAYKLYIRIETSKNERIASQMIASLGGN